jgi:hypothetical protein
MSAKRLTGRQALAAWPDRLAAVNAEPTDDNLQRLCSLLDAIDRWVVQRWGTAGHGDRRATLAAHRREARAANRLVSEAAKTKREAAGRANRAKQGPATSSERLPAVPRVEIPEDRASAA